MGKNKKNRNKDRQVSTQTTTNLSSSARLNFPSVPIRIRIILCAVVAVLAGLLYAGSYSHDFAYDDLSVIKENRFVQKGFGGFKDILNTQYFEGYDPGTNARAYRPVSLLMYATEYEFFGLNPKVHHLVNILIYALTAIVLLLMLLRLLRNYHWILAFLTTLFFVVHPVHVDVVANIKSRDELMGFLNFCLAMLLLLHDLDYPKTWKKILSFVFFFLALASKENMLTTLACIPLLLYFFRDISWTKILRRTLPYAGIFVLFLLIRAGVLSNTDATTSQMTYLDNPILAAKNYNERVGTNIASLGLYLQTVIFPYKLSCDYSYNSIPVTGIGNVKVLGWLLAYIILIVIAVKGFKRKNIYSFCILWFFITISIVSSIFIMSSNAYADRFLYTPSLAFCLALAYAIYYLAGIIKHQQILKFSGKQALASGIVIVLVVLAAIKTIRYVPVWKDDMTLFAYNLKINPDNARMHKNYGGEMVRQAMFIRADTAKAKSGDTATINSLARNGIIELEKAKAIYPYDAIGHIHEANAHIILNNFPEAEKSLRAALAIHSTNRFAYMSLGYILYMTGRYKEAADAWEKIDPAQRLPNDNYNLYLVYYMLGDQQRANYYKQLSGR